jgi:hypothetical protein
MHRSITLLLVLVFLTVSCLITVKPIFSSTAGSWVSRTPMHEERANFGATTVNGKIYAIGGWAYRPAGITNIVEETNSLEEYDPVADTWTYKTPMPTARESFATAVYQNKIYCIGGRANKTILGINEVYDPSADTWETLASMPTPRYGVEACVVDGKIYVVGGGSNVTAVYDAETDLWTTKAPMPVAPDLRFGWSCASAVVDGEIHVIGAFPLSNSHQVYDPVADSWSIGNQVIAGYYYAVAGATSGVMAPTRIYVFGADRCYWSLPENYPERTGQSYNPAAGDWTVCASMPSGRLDAAVVVVNDVLYAIGGFTPEIGGGRGLSAANEQYTPLGYGTPDQPSLTPSQNPTTKPEPFPAVLVAAASVITGVIVSACLIIYFKKRKH